MHMSLLVLCVDINAYLTTLDSDKQKISPLFRSQ